MLLYSCKRPGAPLTRTLARFLFIMQKHVSGGNLETVPLPQTRYLDTVSEQHKFGIK